MRPDNSCVAGQLGYNIQLVNRTTGSNLSAWHDVPLELQVGSDGSVTLNTMVEIPAGEQAKYETVVSMLPVLGTH